MKFDPATMTIECRKPSWGGPVFCANIWTKARLISGGPALLAHVEAETRSDALKAVKAVLLAGHPDIPTAIAAHKAAFAARYPGIDL